MILLIDNYDSFTYNLVQGFGMLGAEVLVRRNDELTLDDVDDFTPDHIVISPGPCTPNEAGISVPLIQAYAGRIPILGVCLGHQAIAAAFGGLVVRAPAVRHGKTSPIYHDGTGLYAGLPNPFLATRYHSLIVDKATLPQCFQITAHTEDDLIMGIRHKEFAIEGVQFHPESILTTEGQNLLKNFLNSTLAPSTGRGQGEGVHA